MLTTLVGTDDFAVYQRIKVLTGGLPVVRLDGEGSIDAWQAVLGQANLFGDLPAVVGRDLFDLPAAQKQELAPLLKQTVTSSQVVVLWIEGWPKKEKLVEVLKLGQVEELAEFSQGRAVSWLLAMAKEWELELERAAAVRLVEVFGTNRWAMQTELAKWRVLGRGTAISRQAVEDCVWLEKSGTVFELVEAWSARSADRCLILLETAYERGDDPQAMISLIERQLRMMKILSFSSGGEAGLAAKLGVPAFVVGKIKKALGKWGVKELDRAICLLYELDLKIKRGQVEAMLGLEMFVVETGGWGKGEGISPKP